MEDIDDIDDIDDMDDMDDMEDRGGGAVELLNNVTAWGVGGRLFG